MRSNSKLLGDTGRDEAISKVDILSSFLFLTAVTQPYSVVRPKHRSHPADNKARFLPMLGNGKLRMYSRNGGAVAQRNRLGEWGSFPFVKAVRARVVAVRTVASDETTATDLCGSRRRFRWSAT
jgi:hypothetical protein